MNKQRDKLPTILGIYKKSGPTSNQVLERLRKITGIKKIGHAGTLDPLASGILVVGITREGTKQLARYEDAEKEYLAFIELGKVSETDDAEGPISETNTINTNDIPDEKEILHTLSQFVGQIEQVPPIYSAIKIKGREAYKYARSGNKEIRLKPRAVNIKSIELLDYSWPMVTIKVVTGKGVYIRALARDIGKQLRLGAYLRSLERTRVGQWSKNNSLTIEDFAVKHNESRF